MIDTIEGPGAFRDQAEGFGFRFLLFLTITIQMQQKGFDWINLV